MASRSPPGSTATVASKVAPRGSFTPTVGLPVAASRLTVEVARVLNSSWSGAGKRGWYWFGAPPRSCGPLTDPRGLTRDSATTRPVWLARIHATDAGCPAEVGAGDWAREAEATMTV